MQGEGITDGDAVLLASGSCGSTRAIVGVEDALRRTEIFSGEDGEKHASFAKSLMQIEPGANELCWCRGACRAIGDFRVSIGILTMAGPRPGQSLDCVGWLQTFRDTVFVF